jgi:hypothetical protein
MMARSWRDYGAEGESAGPRDNSDNSDTRAGAEPETGAFVPNVPFVTALPASVQEGLIALGKAAAPRLCNPELWPATVTDAQRLASDGWAAQALSLGWSALDLFGAVPDAGGDSQGDGLAVKLNGRKVLALCASFATVADASNGRSYLHRGSTEGARLLWELGR